MNKHEKIDFLNLVKEMRIAQRGYFNARRYNDATTASKFLAKAKEMEGQVDEAYKLLLDRIKNGEQETLF